MYAILNTRLVPRCSSRRFVYRVPIVPVAVERVLVDRIALLRIDLARKRLRQLVKCLLPQRTAARVAGRGGQTHRQHLRPEQTAKRARADGLRELSAAHVTVYEVRENEQPLLSATPSGGVLRAFSSYSWKSDDDRDSTGRLGCELRLRGLTVFRDVESLNPGAPVEATIKQELARIALVMPLLTPASLESDPVVEMEFKAARDLHRVHGRPALVPVVRNLGDNHAEVTTNTWERLKYDFGARWIQLATPGDGPLEIEEVARFACEGLCAALPLGEGPRDGCWRISVATRGEPPAADEFLINATELLGGSKSRPGSTADWTRVHAGISDLARVLAAHGLRRDVMIEPHCHLSAAVAVGHAFRFAAGWAPHVHANGAVFPRGTPEHHEIEHTVEEGTYTAAGGTLAAIVDLVPRQIYRCASDSFAFPPRAIAHYTRPAGPQLTVSATTDLAVWVAQDIKRVRGEVKAGRIDLYLCAPAAFAVLLGAELSAVGCPIQLHETHNDTYVPSIELAR